MHRIVVVNHAGTSIVITAMPAVHWPLDKKGFRNWTTVPGQRANHADLRQGMRKT
jgi:hypothetical protein